MEFYFSPFLSFFPWAFFFVVTTGCLPVGETESMKAWKHESMRSWKCVAEKKNKGKGKGKGLLITRTKKRLQDEKQHKNVSSTCCRNTWRRMMYRRRGKRLKEIRKRNKRKWVDSKNHCFTPPTNWLLSNFCLPVMLWQICDRSSWTSPRWTASIEHYVFAKACLPTTYDLHHGPIP